jgi:hypothetical protein
VLDVSPAVAQLAAIRAQAGGIGGMVAAPNVGFGGSPGSRWVNSRVVGSSPLMLPGPAAAGAATAGAAAGAAASTGLKLGGPGSLFAAAMIIDHAADRSGTAEQMAAEQIIEDERKRYFSTLPGGRALNTMAEVGKFVPLGTSIVNAYMAPSRSWENYINGRGLETDQAYAERTLQQEGERGVGLSTQLQAAQLAASQRLELKSQADQMALAMRMQFKSQDEQAILRMQFEKQKFIESRERERYARGELAPSQEDQEVISGFARAEKSLVANRVGNIAAAAIAESLSDGFEEAEKIMARRRGLKRDASNAAGAIADIVGDQIDAAGDAIVEGRRRAATRRGRRLESASFERSINTRIASAGALAGGNGELAAMEQTLGAMSEEYHQASPKRRPRIVAAQEAEIAAMRAQLTSPGYASPWDPSSEAAGGPNGNSTMETNRILREIAKYLAEITNKEGGLPN